MRIVRVFPRRTAATPDDALTFITPPPKAFLQSLESGQQTIEAVHVSVAFSYDMEKAERLAEQWRKTGVPVKLGGPAFNEAGGEFVPGMYLKNGYVITSRGCANNCWFCAVPGREGGAVRELKINEGHLLLDDNLLQCSEKHIRAVFEMLARQKETPRLTGGLEARRLKEWHVELIRKARVKRMYFAYDTPDDYEPLAEAGKILRACGVSRASHSAACYVLIGYEGDTLGGAEKRLRDTWAAGFLPFAMLYRGADGKTDGEWRKFQRLWLRPQIVVKQLN